MASISIDSQIRKIKEDIKKKNLTTTYLLKGEETYYIDLICNEFEKNVIDEVDRDFNQTIVYGKDTSASQLISLCRQYPLMSDKKLVIVKEAQLLEKKEWEKMLLYLTNPLASTVLVICNKAQSFDTKCKNAIIKNSGVIVESEKIKDNQVSKWIISYLAEKKFTIDETSATMLYEYLGNNLQKIANETNKMILNIKDRTNITKEDISEFIGVSKEYNVFELQSALGTKDSTKANGILSYFAQNPKENPIQLIIPVLFSYFTKLLIASQGPMRNANEIATALNFKSPYPAKEYINALNYYSTEQLLNIMSLFNEYDLKSKGIGTSAMTTDAELLKELVFRIIHT